MNYLFKSSAVRGGFHYNSMNFNCSSQILKSNYCNAPETKKIIENIAKKSLISAPNQVLNDNGKTFEMTKAAFTNALKNKVFNEKLNFSSEFGKKFALEFAKETTIQAIKTSTQNAEFISLYRNYLTAEASSKGISLDESQINELIDNLGAIVSASNLELAFAFFTLGNEIASKDLVQDKDMSIDMMLFIISRLTQLLKEENKLQKTLKTVGEIHSNIRDTDILGNLKESASNQISNTLKVSEEVQKKLPTIPNSQESIVKIKSWSKDSWSNIKIWPKE